MRDIFDRIVDVTVFLVLSSCFLGLAYSGGFFVWLMWK